jgi:cell fate (sporulation/competence/biofilm development) regulator YlbF (YheA/YmcA/DUF963 family)
MSSIQDMARDLGRALARTDEYQALRRAIDSTGDDRELAVLRSTLEGLEGKIEAAIRAGTEPEDDVKTEYEDAVGQLQSNSAYQRLVVAQANFDKILYKVNQTIEEGLAAGAQSRIVLP